MIKVLYITGWGRSGSTILGNILGQIDGFVSVGELRYLSERGLTENRICGCGSRFRDCEFWKSILNEVLKNTDSSYSKAEMIFDQRYVDDRYLPIIFLPGKEKYLNILWARYLRNIKNLYCVIASHTHSRLIIDSSKLPLYGYALSMIPGIELYIVHLVRDPRSVAYSWMRKKIKLDKGVNTFLPQHHPLKSALQWNLVNTAAASLRKLAPERYYLLRYEDFIVEPEKSIQKILQLTGYPEIHLPFLDYDSVKLDVSHTFSGNPNRLTTGTVKLRLDDEWKVRMKYLDKVLVTIQCLPLLLKYQYLLK